MAVTSGADVSKGNFKNAAYAVSRAFGLLETAIKDGVVKSLPPAFYLSGMRPMDGIKAKPSDADRWVDIVKINPLLVACRDFPEDTSSVPGVLPLIFIGAPMRTTWSLPGVR